MFRSVFVGAAASLVALFSAPAFAQPEGPQSEPAPEFVTTPAEPDLEREPTEEELATAIAEFEASLEKQTGTIKLPGANITLAVPSGFYFLDAEDGRAVLEDAWGNPPDSTISGMLFPAGKSPFDQGVWGVVFTYDPSGYVSDADAADIDYDMLAAEMRDSIDTENAARKSQGYQTIDFVGWATQPRYDSKAHKLYWAKELAFEGEDLNTLNYEMRVLGRHGVLSLNFVTDMNQLGGVEAAAPAVLAIPEFDAGYRYEDFNQATDAKADYGIAGLVGGAAAAAALAKNGGFLAAALLFLKKGWFLIFGAIAGIGAAFRALFNRTPKAAKQAEQRAATAFFDGPAAADPAPPANPEPPPPSATS